MIKVDVRSGIQHNFDVSTSQLRDVKMKVRTDTSPNRIKRFPFSSEWNIDFVISKAVNKL